MDIFYSHLTTADKAIAELLESEELRQEREINLIASENYAPVSVREAIASALTNKYAEGYPTKRYYAGCSVVDIVEQLAIDRVKELFGAEHANVQPHAGSQANMALYAALLKPGDTILGMSLAAGGHLTHGHLVNFSGVFYKSVQYGVNPQTELIDYDELERLAHEAKPKLIMAGASAYSRVIDFERIRKIADSVGAFFVADIAHIAGLIAAKLHPSPVPIADAVTSTTHKTLRGPRGGLIMAKDVFGDKIDKSLMPGLQGGPLMHVIGAKATAFYLALQPKFVEYQKQVLTNARVMAEAFKERGYRIVADGTDTHLFIVDLRNKKINGKTAEQALEKAGITVNRNTVPFDPEKPWIGSGIRIGTPAITTRGMKEPEVLQIVEWIDDIISLPGDERKQAIIRAEAADLCKKFPIY